MKVLVVGGAGFLGQAICEVLHPEHDVCAADLQPAMAPYGSLRLDVTEYAAVREAMTDCDAFVNAMMSAWQAYDGDASEAFASNVHGTYNLFEAARDAKVGQAVQISSGAVYGEHPGLTCFANDTPQQPTSAYGLCKVLQEQVARYFADHHGMRVTAFRPWSIYDGETGRYKHGEPIHEAQWGNISRHDIGRAVALALAAPQPGYRAYVMAGTPAARDHLDWEPLERDLGWRAGQTNGG